MQGAMESCIGKSVMAGVAGFALGGAFGLFMASVSNFASFDEMKLRSNDRTDAL